MSNLKFGLQLELQGDKVVVRGLQGVQGEVKALTGQLGDNTTQTGKQVQANEKLAQSFNSVRGVITALGVGYLVKEYITLTDQYNTLDQRIKTATRSTGDYTSIQRELFEITQDNGAALRDTVGVFQQFSRAKASLGATNEEMLILTDTVQKLGVIGGATNEDMSNGLRQLGQALASPKVQAEELNSILDSLPEVAVRIEQGLGLLPGTLKQAVQAGDVLSKDIFQTLLKQAPEVAAEFKEIPLSVERATTMLANSVARSLGLIDDKTDAMQGLSSAIGGVSKAIDGIDTRNIQNAIDIVALGAVAIAAAYSGPVAGAYLAAGAAQASYAAKVAAGSVVTLNSVQAEAGRTKVLLAQAEAQAVAAAADVRATAAEVAGYRATLQAIEAEIALEQVRFRAQISDKGRELSIQRMAAARMDLAAATAALARVEAGHTSATQAAAVADKARAAALANFTAASNAATLGSRALAGATGLLRGAMALLGGPVGAAITAASALWIFRDSIYGLIDPAGAAKDKVDQLLQSMAKADDDQLGQALVDTLREIDTELEKTAERHAELSKIQDDAARSWAELEDEKFKSLATERELYANLLEIHEAGKRQAEDHAVTLRETVSAVDELKVAETNLKRDADLALDAAIRDAREYSDRLEDILDRLYPQQAAVRELKKEWDFLRSAIKTTTGKMPQELQDWLDANVAVKTSIRQVSDEVKNLEDEADPLAESWQEALNRIDSAFVDLWKSAFDGFDDFSDALKDAFIQLLAELAHRATTQQILIALGLDYGQGSSSSRGGSGGSGNLLSLAGMLEKGLGGIGKAGMGLFELIGASNYAATTANAGQSIAGLVGADDLSLNAQVGVGIIANIIAGAAGSWAGTKLAEELFGKNAESAYGATVGGVIGSLWGPLGSAIGGAIGGAIDVITGGDGKTRSALGVATNADWTVDDPQYQAQGASGLLYTAYQKRAGDQGADIAQQMMQVFVATDYALTSLLESLGATVDLAGGQLAGKSSQEGEAGSGFFGATGYNGAITEADLRGAADQYVREFVAAVNEANGTAFDLEPVFALQLEGEMLGDTLLRVQAEAAGVNQIFTALGYSTYELSVAGMVAADNLVQAAGGLQNLASLTDYYYQNTYSEQERAQMLADQYTAVLADFNGTFGTAITNTQDLRAYVDSLAASESWASEETQAAYLAALQLTPALVGLVSALETVGNTVDDVVDDVLSAGQLNTLKDIASTIFGNFTDRQETIADLQDQLADIDAEIADIGTGLQDGLDPIPDVIGTITDSVDTLTRSSSELRSQADSIFNTIASLSLGSTTHLTNREQLDFARQQYEEAQRLFDLTGDSGQLGSAATAYQQEIAQYFAGNDTGRTLSDNIIQYLGTVGVSLDTQADAAERAEQIAEAQRVALESLNVTQATALDTAQENARLDQLYQERQLIEQQLANLTAVDSQAIMEGQLNHLVDITGGIDTLNELLGVLPADIADALAQQLGIAIAEYRALTDVEQFFAGLADAGIASFDTGTPFVTRDQTANIHRGEIILDPASSEVLRRYGINVQGVGNADVVARLDAILTRLESLEGTTGTGFVRSEQQRERHIIATENVAPETARQLNPVVV